MKKAITLLLALILFLLTACNAIINVKETADYSKTSAGISGQNNSETSTQKGTKPTESTLQDEEKTEKKTTFPNGLWKQPNEVSAELATLIKEDGTGDIFIGMKRNEVIKVLEKEGIYYDIDKNMNPRYAAIKFTDGSFFSFGDALERFEATQTNKGLKIGDLASKIEELYGKAEIDERAVMKYYIYHYGGDITLTVGAEGKDNSAKITYIEIESKPSWAYESGASA